MAEKIDLFIIGAQKAGTTSLKNYLSEHPSIKSHYAQEFSFFYDDEEYTLGVQKAFKKYFTEKETAILQIAKHAHLYSSEKAIERLYHHNPNCKLIFILRNPVERTFSSYMMEKLYNRVDFEFDQLEHAINGSDLLQLEPWQREAILEFGYYENFLPSIYKYFPKNQVRLVLFEDFMSKPMELCQTVFRELNLKHDYYPRTRVKHNETALPRSEVMSNLLRKYLISDNKIKSNFGKVIPPVTKFKIGNMLRNLNRSNKNKVQISEKMTFKLKEHFYPHICELEKMTGFDLGNWK
jgi:Sulfotransferase domain